MGINAADGANVNEPEDYKQRYQQLETRYRIRNHRNRIKKIP